MHWGMTNQFFTFVHLKFIHQEGKPLYALVWSINTIELSDRKIFKLFFSSIWNKCSGVTLLFEHLLNRASEIENFKIFSRPQENQLT